MKNQIDTVIQRTQRYWYIDGLSEMAVGVFILVLGLFYYLLYALPFASFTGSLMFIGQPVIIILLWWLGRKAVRVLKERITYPRTGYVAYPRKSEKGNRLILGGLIGLVMGGILGGMMGLVFGGTFPINLTMLKMNLNILPLLFGTGMALAIGMLAYRFGLVRFYMLAFYTLGLGLITACLPLVDLQQTAFLFSLLGLGWIVSGTVTFIHYIKSTEPANQEGL